MVFPAGIYKNRKGTSKVNLAASSEFGTYRLCEQRRFRRACASAVSPEPPLLAHTSSESRGTFRQNARSLAPLNGWACAVRICHDGMLEDTNSLDGAHIKIEKELLRLIGFQGGVFIFTQQGRSVLYRSSEDYCTCVTVLCYFFLVLCFFFEY